MIRVMVLNSTIYIKRKQFSRSFQVVNKGTILLNNTQSAQISLRLTIPFGCQQNVSPCYIDVNVFMPRTNRCELADVGIKQTTPNSCGIRFYSNETGVTKQLTLQAISVPRTRPQNRIVSANLVTQSVYEAHTIFGSYKIDTLTVSFQFLCQEI